MQVAAPLAQAVHRMPAREHRIVGAGHPQVGGEQHPAHGGQRLDDRPHRRTERGERLENGRRVLAQPVEHGRVPCRPHRFERRVLGNEIEGETDAERADRTEHGDRRVGAGRSNRRGPRRDIAERSGQPELLVSRDRAGVPEDPPDRRLYRPRVPAGDLDPVGHAVSLAYVAGANIVSPVIPETSTVNATVSRSLPVRVALLLTGSLISTICYAVTIRARLGLGPLYVLQDGIARHAGITIGTSVTLTGFALVFVAGAMRAWPGPGTLVLPLLGGVTLDRLVPHVPILHGWPLRLAAVAGATWMMALAGALMIRASVGVAAYDAVMLGLHRILGRPLSPIRLAMEASALVAGWVLGGAIGVGTAITGLLIGPGIQFWLTRIGEPSRRVPRRTGAR